MDILGLLPKMLNGNQFVLVMTDHYSRAVPTCKTTALHIASIFMDLWILPYEIPAPMLTNNGIQVVSKLF